MTLRWTLAAIADLVEIRRRVAKDDPSAATRLAGRLRAAPERLVEHPGSGRAGRVPDTRELVVPGTPYVIPYRVVGIEVHVLRVLHGAREWPDAL